MKTSSILIVSLLFFTILILFHFQSKKKLPVRVLNTVRTGNNAQPVLVHTPTNTDNMDVESNPNSTAEYWQNMPVHWWGNAPSPTAAQIAYYQQTHATIGRG